MSTIISAIDTLYDAVIACAVRVVRAYIYADEMQKNNEIADTPDSVVSLSLPSPAHTTQEEDVQHIESIEAQRVSFARGAVMYACNAQVPIFKNPTIEYDAQIGTVPFGAMIIVGEMRGRFCEVTWNAVSGWILKEDLADRAASVYPVFKKGDIYHVDSPGTAQVRSIIHDEFGLGRSEFDLQAGEYILYRLWKRGIRIAWPSVRPRVPGMWHEILASTSGVRTGSEPRVGSIMEYMLDGDMGHLAYVEAVFPDETISISEVNNPDSGIYNECEMRKEEWKALKPIFIEVV